MPHFILSRGKQEYLIFRTGEEFHIVEVNEALTRETRAAILEQGCTPDEMRQLGLSGMTIPRSDIRALTVTGCGCQDDVIFYLSRGKEAFRFSRAYDQRQVDNFFRGIPRKQVKIRTRVHRGKTRDWRLEKQNETLRTRLGIAATVAQVLSWAGFLGVTLSRRNQWLIGLSFVMLLVDLGLYLAFPAYFTLMGEKAYQKNGYRAKVRDMGMPAVFCVFGLGVRGMGDYTLIFERAEIYMVAAVCAVLGILLWRFSRECREHIEYLLMALAVAALFGGPCLAQLNYLTDLDLPEPQYYAVIDTDRSIGGKSTHYDCTVDLGDGQTMELAITRSAFEELEPGDRVPVILSEGGLGLEYGYFDVETYEYG